jgi:CSLREA domain-containing protein
MGGYVLALVFVFVLLACTGSARADVYWGNFLTAFGQGESSYIGHARLDGSEANAQFLSVKKEHPARLAADARYLYGAFPSGETGHGAIGRSRLDGAEHNAKFITGLSTVWGIAVSSQYIYWTNFIHGEPAISEIGRAKIDGSEAIPDFISLPSTGQAYGLALEGEYLYWSGGSGIGRANLDGEPASVDPTFIPKPLAGFAWGVAADPGHIYWTHGTAIGRASITGANVEPEFIAGLESTGTSAIAVGAGELYWGNEPGHAIARANTSGGGLEQQFIPGAGDPDGIAVDRRIVVNSTADYQDATPGDGVCAAKEHESMCTLRAAVEEVDAQHSSVRADIGFEIPGGQLETISLTKPLPKIESPVYLDARGQHGALIAGKRKVGAIVDGTNAGSEANGLQLASGAAGSIVAGLQLQHFGGDGVLLEGENEQLADSVLVEDNIGAEVAANNDVVGSGEASGEGASEKLPGDIFFRDGRQNVVGYLKGLAKKHESGEKFQLGLDAFGAAIDMTKPSSGTRVTGDYIGIHGPGFSEGADKLAEDGLKSFSEIGAGFPIGVLISPTSAGAISNVTIGGTGESADVDSATMFGVLALGEDGAPINGLSIRGSSFGTNAAGEGLEPFGGLFGVFALGSIKGLEIGAAGEGDSFKGLLAGALLAGQKLESPTIQGDTFGVPSAVGNPSNSFDQHDAIGLMLSDVQGASVGGASSAQGNLFPGAIAAIAMNGEHLNHDTISHNTIGTPPATPFTTFQNLPSTYESVFGIFTTNVFKPTGKGEKIAGQALTLEGNTIQNTVIGIETENVKGLQMFANTLENDALAMADSGSGGEQIGGPGAGQGNSFLNDGFGLLQSNENPSSSSLQQASVNPEDTKSSTKEGFLGVPDEEVAYDVVDAVSTAALSPTSANTSAEPGSENAITGNRFGISTGGSPQPDELPVTISGDEHGLRFGGTNAGEGNIVENNRAGGLLLGGHLDHYPSAQILGNTIFNNEDFTSSLPIPGLGINLTSQEGAGVLGVDPQEPIQPAAGANNLQNSPVLSSANSSAGALTLTGSLHGVGNTNYVLEVYADETQNPFGAGEGQTLLERINLSTDPSGNVVFTSAAAAPGASYRYISATATTVPAGGEPGVTSEFSINQPIATQSSPSTGGGSSSSSTTTGTSPSTSPSPPSPSGPKGAESTTVSAKGGTASTGSSSVTLPVQASCSSATASPCTVTTTATLPSATAGKASVAAVLAGGARAHLKTPLTIGRGSMSLARGASAPLRLSLTKRGLALLRTRHTLAITVTVRITGQGRPTIVRMLHIKLKYKPRTRSKR